MALADQPFDLDLRIHDRSGAGAPAIVAADVSDEAAECRPTDSGACRTPDCLASLHTCDGDECRTAPCHPPASHDGCETQDGCPDS